MAKIASTILSIGNLPVYGRCNKAILLYNRANHKLCIFWRQHVRLSMVTLSLQFTSSLSFSLSISPHLAVPLSLSLSLFASIYSSLFAGDLHAQTKKAIKRQCHCFGPVSLLPQKNTTICYAKHRTIKRTEKKKTHIPRIC